MPGWQGPPWCPSRGGQPAGCGAGGVPDQKRITAMCCVPTLLATLDEDLPDLRFLLVSGEACPKDLVIRWHRPGRRFLNVYGPTEATVTATWALRTPTGPCPSGCLCPLTRPSSSTPLSAAPCPGRGRGNRTRGGGPGPGIRQPAGPDRAGLCPGLPGDRQQPLRPDIPHRGPGPDERRRASSSTSAGSTPRSRYAATASS